MRNLFFILFILVLFFCASILGACSSFFSTKAVFSLPEELFLENEEITLYLTGQKYGEETYIFSKGEKIELNVTENIPLAITVENSGRKNYGALYPFQTEISLKNGFASSILRTLYNGSQDYQDFSLIQEYIVRFNWKRFLEELDKVENVWLLDSNLIINSIASDTFSSNKIKVLSP